MMNANLCVTRCRFGYGVRTRGGLSAGLVIMRTPYILVSSEESSRSLEHYRFHFPYKKVAGKFVESSRSRKCAIVFGWASLINHSDEPNCMWTWNPSRRLHLVKTIREIEFGEELFYDYGYGYASD
jgi:SET domain-containing protein